MILDSEVHAYMYAMGIHVHVHVHVGTCICVCMILYRVLSLKVLMVDHKTGKPLPFGSLGIHKVIMRLLAR